MNLGVRRVLLSIFTIIFLVAAPAILLYSTGYRFDFSTLRFRETGTLVLRSLPEDSVIEIDGKIHDKSTPSVISRLIPGAHTIKISSPEYTTWEKEIFISPRLTTFAENIQLFPSVIQEQPLAKSDEKIFLSPHSQLAVKTTYLKNRENLFLIDLSDKEAPITEEAPFLTLSSQEQIENMSWSNNEKKIILQTSLSSYVIEPERNKKSISLFQKFGFIADRYEWHPTDDNIIFAAYKDSLWKLNLVLEEKEIIVSRGVYQKNLSIRNNNLFIPIRVLEFSKQFPSTTADELADPAGWYLIQFDIRKIGEGPEIIRDLPVFTQTSELHVTRSFISVSIPQQKRWYLLARMKDPSQAIEPIFTFQSDNIELLTWNGDFTKAAYVSNNQLWFADLGFDTFAPPVSLSTVDKTATSLRWMPGDWHILVTTPFAVDVIEADLHTPPLSRRIIERDKKISPLEPLTNGDFLYVLVQDGPHPGAIRFSIFEEK